MTFKKSVKLTMLSVSLAAVAITGCKGNSDDNKATTETGTGYTAVSKAGFAVTIPDIPLKGCSSYSVSYTDAKGNQAPQSDITLSLIGQSTAKFKLANGHICALKADDKEAKKVRDFEEAKVGESAFLEIKHKDGAFLSKEIKVTNAILKSVQLKSADGKAHFTSLQIPQGATTPEKLGFTILGTDTAGNEFPLTEKNSKVTVTDVNGKELGILSYADGSDGKKLLVTALKDMPYVKDSLGFDYKIKISSLDNAGNITANSETKLNIKVTEAIVKGYAVDFPSNIKEKSETKIEVKAIYTDGSEKIVDQKDLKLTVKSYGKSGELTGLINNNKFIIDSKDHTFKDENDLLILNVNVGNVNSKLIIDENYTPGMLKEINHLFVIGNAAPNLSIAYQGFLEDQDKKFGYIKNQSTAPKELAKGGEAFIENAKKTADSIKLASECVKLISTLQVGDVLVKNIDIGYNLDAKNTDFSFNDKNIVCAKKGAKLNNTLKVYAALKYNIDIAPDSQKIDLLTSTNNINISVGNPIKLSKFTFGNEVGEKVFYLNAANNYKQTIFAYYKLSDDTINANHKVDSSVLNNLTFTGTNEFDIKVVHHYIDKDGVVIKENPYFEMKQDKVSHNNETQGIKVAVTGNTPVIIGNEKEKRAITSEDFDYNDIEARVQLEAGK